jgi:hypothetical protein
LFVCLLVSQHFCHPSSRLQESQEPEADLQACEDLRPSLRTRCHNFGVPARVSLSTKSDDSWGWVLRTSETFPQQSQIDRVHPSTGIASWFDKGGSSLREKVEGQTSQPFGSRMGLAAETQRNFCNLLISYRVHDGSSLLNTYRSKLKIWTLCSLRATRLECHLYAPQLAVFAQDAGALGSHVCSSLGGLIYFKAIKYLPHSLSHK